MFFKKPIKPVDDLKAEVSRLRRMIRTDELTGVLNRRGIQEEFGTLFDEAKYAREHEARRRLNFTDICVLFFDLDNFKPINDTYGHDAGDAVLVELAQTLSQNIRGLDRVGRWGGEEFLVLLVGANEKEGAAKAEKILEKIRAMKVKEAPRQITASIGVASIELSEARTLDALIEYADKAMYDAKKNKGKNTVVCSSQI